jgi:uncharacterized protein (DUF1501 family)
MHDEKSDFMVNRRAMLSASVAAPLGLSLTDILGARATAAESAQPVRNTSVIFVTLGGGPSQFETYDPKPNAAVEYRGPFQSISTALPGVTFCELLPKQAAMMDQLAIVRSIHHKQASHIAEHIVETGYDLRNAGNSRVGEMPSIGSVVSKIRGRNAAGIPSYVSLPRHHAYAGPHWLGAQHRHFAINEDPSLATFQVSNVSINDKLDLNRLNDRRALQRELDGAQQTFDLHGNAAALQAISRQAFDLITGERARNAFDISQESPATRDRYGRNTLGQRMLLARRLVEAGVPFVTVRMGDWDDHQELAKKITKRTPAYDTGITALIEDLRQRGLRRDVLVVAMGEFGRTPRFNGTAGRDHWPAVNSVLFSGGDFRMGQVIGATDRSGGRVVEAPYTPQSALTMVYRHLGIDPATTFNDYSGRPQYVLENREPITELL